MHNRGNINYYELKIELLTKAVELRLLNFIS